MQSARTHSSRLPGNIGQVTLDTMKLSRVDILYRKEVKDQGQHGMRDQERHDCTPVKYKNSNTINACSNIFFIFIALQLILFCFAVIDFTTLFVIININQELRCKFNFIFHGYNLHCVHLT